MTCAPRSRRPETDRAYRSGFNERGSHSRSPLRRRTPWKRPRVGRRFRIPSRPDGCSWCATATRISVVTRGVGRYTLLLSPEQFDFAQPVRVTTNEVLSFEGMVEPSAPDPAALGRPRPRPRDVVRRRAADRGRCAVGEAARGVRGNPRAARVRTSISSHHRRADRRGRSRRRLATADRPTRPRSGSASRHPRAARRKYPTSAPTL